MRRAPIALAASGVAAGVAAEWSSYLPDDPAQAAADFAVGLAFVIGGALTLGRSRTTAVLMAATGFAWFAGGLASGLVFLHRGPLVHLLLSYPRGRLESRFERVVVACAYAPALVHPLGRSNVATLVLLAAVLLAAALRYARAGGAERRARAAALAATAAVAGALGTAAVLRLAGAPAGGTMLWVYEAVLALVAAGLCADLLWGRWTAAAVRGLVMDLGDLEHEATLRTRLARSVGDPSLELGFWDPARGGYVDERGALLGLPEDGPGRSPAFVGGRPAPTSSRLVMLVHDERGNPAAAIVHDPAVLDEPGLREAVTAAVRIAVANVGLQSRVRAKVDEVLASRRRLVEAADLERRRLEGELRDASEPRLRAIADELRAFGPEAGELTRDLDGVRDELRELGLGLHPRALTESGLVAALTELGERFPFSVEVSADGAALPPGVAAAAYFVCSEGLANAAKHARASRVGLTAERHGTTLVVRVEDDGAGGADLARGSGLRGLADRAEAMGGQFALESPVGGGTRLEARLPVRVEASAQVTAGAAS
jgi:signal transduction histidine kinase